MAADASLREAAAKVDRAWSLFLPKLTVTARYLRLSDFEQPLVFGGGTLVGTTAPPGTPNPPSAAVAPFRFPNVLDQYALEATIAVPVSDYAFRIANGYAAAQKGKDATALLAVAAKAQASTQGRLAYYGWLRALAVRTVAEQALSDQKLHKGDVDVLRLAGLATDAEVLRSAAAVSGAELQLAHVTTLVALADKQLRTLLHAPADESWTAVEDLRVAPTLPVTLGAEVLEKEALGKRCELRALRLTAEALDLQAKAEAQAAWPSIALVGSALYANPNPRLQPPDDRWLGTWALGVQLSFSPTDWVGSSATAQVTKAQASGVGARAAELRDAIGLEVVQAVSALAEARIALVASADQESAAEKSWADARVRFQAGKLSSTALTDIETELTRARLSRVNAGADARIAKVRLEHALGRDVPACHAS
jgi:outer membrane protein TolC